MEKIISLAKRRGFVYQGSEIYGGLAGTWDYGPLGVSLKNNVKNIWWKQFVESRTDMFGLDAAILMNPKVWEASGHVGGFSDPLVECAKCHKRFRSDHVEGNNCPECSGVLGEARQFDMMFKTNIGATEDPDSISYLRPETAQGIFVNFKNVVDSFSPKLPFGIGQIGKAFRNEIAPRDFIFRVRELEQMEVEYFVRESDWETYFEAWRREIVHFTEVIGLPKNMVHEVEVEGDDRAHYSKRTIDFEFDFPFGQKELYGLAYRGDYDLTNHKLNYFDQEANERFVPHVIEPSLGVDRTILALLTSAYTEEKLGDDVRVYLKLKPSVAPIIVAVSPLLKNKPELVEKAQSVFADLKREFGRVMFDDNGNIGKRYRRQDEIGTPFCVTIDFDSLDDDTVTVRSRDTAEQERMSIDKLGEYIAEKIK
ncbi:glycine--tRNA ligase [Candidatus Wolfebacteria bacterium]|nr:MAG: glycine--tRNA ligase [Candidatus Wolfebacteria bacterium]